MSIATHSLLRRILDEVRRGPVPTSLFTVRQDTSATHVLELRRSRTIYQPPFATSLHFWAHGLRAFLAARGRPDAFDALATNCLCESLDADAVGPTLLRLGKRVTPPILVEHRDGYPAGYRREYRAGYRMLDQGVVESYVAECPEEFVALFWVDRTWLRSARHLEIT